MTSPYGKALRVLKPEEHLRLLQRCRDRFLPLKSSKLAINFNLNKIHNTAGNETLLITDTLPVSQLT